MRSTVFLALMAASIVVGLGAALLLASHSSVSFAQPALPSGVSEDELFGTMLRSSKWPKMPIQVCWENPAADNLKGRTTTQAAVKATWEANAAILFDGWTTTCDVNSLGVRILISDTGEPPGSLGVGKYLSKRPHGLTLNFAYKNWGQNCQSNVDFCISAIAVHEFGHIVGLTHEQNRDDAPPQCKKDQQGIIGDYKVTKYDASSIMNYCNPKWNGDGKLSGLDIRAVQTVYGQ